MLCKICGSSYLINQLWSKQDQTMYVSLCHYLLKRAIFTIYYWKIKSINQAYDYSFQYLSLKLVGLIIIHNGLKSAVLVL